MRAQAPKGDIVLVARIKHQLVAALRLQPVGHYHLLRSMCVKQALRRSGIGSALLAYAQPHLAQIDCFTFPYTHLHDFYTRQGFITITPTDAPEAIVDRFQRYTNQGRSLCLMKHDSSGVLK